LTSVCRRAARVTIEAARAGVAEVVGLPTRVCGRLALLFTAPVQASASLIGRIRFMNAGLAHRLTRLRRSSMIACQGAGRAAVEAGNAGVKHGHALLTVSADAAGRLVAAGRVAATRLLDLLIQAKETTRDLGSIAATASGRVLSHLGARTPAIWQRERAAGARTRRLLGVGTGIVSVAVLVAAIMLSWPPQGPHRLVDREPALTRTSPPAPVSAPQPAPAEMSRPETPLGTVTVRRQPSGAQAEIPAPVRRSEPAPAQGRAPAPVPSSEGPQNSEASDPTAAIDWLLKGGSGRRHSESP
jgi:hypothetical protein